MVPSQSSTIPLPRPGRQRRPGGLALAGLLAWLLAGRALPQAPPAPWDPVVYTIKEKELDELGSTLLVLGDVDGDGVKDFASPIQYRVPDEDSPWGPGALRNQGKVVLFSGRDGRRLRTWAGKIKTEGFGAFGLFLYPDLDGDGLAELAVPAWRVGLRVLSPVTGEEWFTEASLVPQGRSHDRFTYTPCPDLDGDAIGELLVGEPEAEPLPYFPALGRLRCVSGKTRETLWARWGGAVDSVLGVTVLVSGDHDGDGHADLLCCERVPSAPLPGRMFGEPDFVVRILSGRDGRTIATVSPPTPYHFRFGIRMASLGDRDGNGFPEVAIAAPGHRLPLIPARPSYANFHFNVGWVGVYSLPEFRLLFSQTGREGGVVDGYDGDFFGQTLKAAGDVDGDGIVDLAVGTWRLYSLQPYRYGRTYLISGKEGRTLSVFQGLQGSTFFPTGVSSLDDLDGDGRAEWMISTHLEPFFDGQGRRAATGGIRVLRHDPFASRFIRGDVDGDGRVTLTDALTILTHGSPEDCRGLLAPPPPAAALACPEAWDIDSDGCIDFEDARQLLLYLFDQGLRIRAQMAPYPDCAAFHHFRVAGDIWAFPLGCTEGPGCDGG